jgi:hypothetical protein
MNWARSSLLTLLVIEGVGGIVFAALTVIIGESITPGFIPWSFAVTPGLFGIAALVVAVLVWRRHVTAIYLAVVIQALVGLGAIIGLTSSREPALWVALAMSLVGLWLAAVATRNP